MKTNRRNTKKRTSTDELQIFAVEQKIVRQETPKDLSTLDPSKVSLILPARFRDRSVAFCEWIQTHFDRLDSGDAAEITTKAQLLFIGSLNRPDAKPSIAFGAWLKKEFDVDDLSSAAITSKAEEAFLSASRKQKQLEH